MTGIVVGIDENQGSRNYRVLLYQRSKDDCQYATKMMTEAILIQNIQNKQLILDNVDVVNGRLKGKTGELSRFKAKGFHPIVILTEIVADEMTIGYRVVNYDGKVKAVRLKDILGYCNRVNLNGAPIQNAMYVPENGNGGREAHIRAYPGQTFYKEIIQRSKSPVATPAKVDRKANQKQISKLEELFNQAQIKQLKYGKAHGVDIRIYGDNKLSADQMEQIRLALESGVNAQPFADPAYSAEVMKALRIQAKYGVDITYFINPKFNVQQIFELSSAYLSGVDVAQLADPSMSAKDMSKKRIYLESQLWNTIEDKDE